MRFDYSIIRYQPDAVAGEFVNIGVIVTDGRQCSVVGDIQRSRVTHMRHGVEFMGAAREALHRIEAQAFEFDRRQASLDIPGPTVAAWIDHLVNTERSVVYITPPNPVVGESAEQIAQELEAEYLLHLTHRKPGETRATAKSSLRKSLRGNLQRERWAESIQLITGQHSQRQMIDFVVRNGEVRQLSHAWSFRTRNTQDRETEVKAWGFVIGQLKEYGGTMMIGDDEVPVSPSVDVDVFVLPPKSGAADYDRALDMFDLLEVKVAEQPDEIASRAAALLAH